MNVIEKYFNGMAHKWDTLEKRSSDEVAYFIADNVDISYGAKVLDVGCGTGIADDVLYALAGTKVTAVDISEEMVKIAKLAHPEYIAEYIAADYYTFEHTPFDIIVCFNAYPHFTDSKAFAEQSAKLLKRGGKLYILHNLSKETLTALHSAIPHGISRSLLPAGEEAAAFSEHFTVARTVDSVDSYVIELIKN